MTHRATHISTLALHAAVLTPLVSGARVASLEGHGRRLVTPPDSLLRHQWRRPAARRGARR
eukprot:4662778-Pyramimonas_sp.AAC.1